MAGADQTVVIVHGEAGNTLVKAPFLCDARIVLIGVVIWFFYQFQVFLLVTQTECFAINPQGACSASYVLCSVSLISPVASKHSSRRHMSYCCFSFYVHFLCSCCLIWSRNRLHSSDCFLMSVETSSLPYSTTILLWWGRFYVMMMNGGHERGLQYFKGY